MSKRSLPLTTTTTITEFTDVEEEEVGQGPSSSKRTKRETTTMAPFNPLEFLRNAEGDIGMEPLKLIVRFYADLVWRDYVLAGRRCRGGGDRCRVFSGLILSTPVPSSSSSSSLKETERDSYANRQLSSRRGEIPWKKFPFQRGFWGPEDPKKDGFGTFYTFPLDKPTGESSSSRQEKQALKIINDRRRTKGLEPLDKKPDVKGPQKTDRLKIGHQKPDYEENKKWGFSGPTIDMRYYHYESNNMIETGGCKDALVLPVSKCFLGLSRCKEHEGCSFKSFKELAFTYKEKEFNAFSLFLNECFSSLV